MWRFFTANGSEKRIPASVTNPQAVIYNNATQSLANGAQTPLTMNTILSSTDSGMTATANRITITKAGKYLLEGAVAFTSNATGSRQVFLRINGTNAPASVQNNTDSSAEAHYVVSHAVDLAVGDYVELVAAQTSGGALNVNAAAANNLYACSLSVTKIDGAVVSYVGVPGSLVGQELAYNEITAAVSGITGANASLATSIITSSAVTYDGSTPVWVEFYCPALTQTVSADRINFELFMDTTDVCQIGNAQLTNTLIGPGVTLRRRVTPSAGSHTFTVKAFTPDGGSGTVQAGNGTAGQFAPAFIRVTRAA